jgi:hypothetical protein
MANNMTMAGMMGQSAKNGTAPVPQQTFSSANILGTPVPQVGDNAARPNYAAAIGGTSSTHIVIVAVAIVAIGYLAFHLNFEK